MKFLIASIISLMLINTESDWLNNYEQAKQEASQNNKMILLNFSGSDWCAPCIKLKKEIFESAPFVKYAQSNLVMLRADFPRLKKNQLDEKQTAHNESLAEKFNPEGKFPFTVLLDANGNKLNEWDGYAKNLTIEKMIQEISKSKK
jgi:thioredoxin-related protein